MKPGMAAEKPNMAVMVVEVVLGADSLELRVGTREVAAMEEATTVVAAEVTAAAAALAVAQMVWPVGMFVMVKPDKAVM